MWIEKIALKNWGIYQDTTFDFPTPSSLGATNVVLVGGENGRGKTSLLRAVAFCLYGQEAIEDYNRGGQKAVEPPIAAYKANLNGIFSHTASSSAMSVQVDIKDGENTLSIKREWKFSNREFEGERKETVKILENGHSLTHGFSEIELRGHIKEIVSKRFIPYSLARFFLFDSAKVMGLADVSKQNQIKEGVDSILGIRVLQDLAADLNKYKSDKIREAGGNEGTHIAETNKKIDDLSEKIGKFSDKISRVDGEIISLAEKESLLVDRLVKMGAENLDIGRLIKSREVESKKRESAADKLREAICEDFAMLAVGRSHIDLTLGQMQSEKSGRGWESDKKEGDDDKLSAFLRKMEGKMNISPPITSVQIKSLVSAMRDVWNEVWYPTPEGIPVAKIHECLPDVEIEKAINNIGSLLQKGGSEILAICQDYRNADKNLGEIEAQIGERAPDDAKDSEKIKGDLKDIQSKRESLIKQKAELEREKRSHENELVGQKQELGRLLTAQKSNLPHIVKAKEADKAVKVIDKIIDEARSRHLLQISEGMTAAFLSMAHKKMCCRLSFATTVLLKWLEMTGRTIGKKISRTARVKYSLLR